MHNLSKEATDEQLLNVLCSLLKDEIAKMGCYKVRQEKRGLLF